MGLSFLGLRRLRFSQDRFWRTGVSVEFSSLVLLNQLFRSSLFLWDFGLLLILLWRHLHSKGRALFFLFLFLFLFHFLLAGWRLSSLVVPSRPLLLLLSLVVSLNVPSPELLFFESISVLWEPRRLNERREPLRPLFLFLLFVLVRVLAILSLVLHSPLILLCPQLLLHDIPGLLYLVDRSPVILVLLLQPPEILGLLLQSQNLRVPRIAQLLRILFYPPSLLPLTVLPPPLRPILAQLSLLL